MRKQVRRNIDWETPEGSEFMWQHVVVEVLMDIRDELRTISRTLTCYRFQGIPARLDAIHRKIPTRRKKK